MSVSRRANILTRNTKPLGPDKSRLNDYKTSKGDQQTHRSHLLSGIHCECTTARCQQVPAV